MKTRELILEVLKAYDSQDETRFFSLFRQLSECVTAAAEAVLEELASKDARYGSEVRP